MLHKRTSKDDDDDLWMWCPKCGGNAYAATADELHHCEDCGWTWGDDTDPDYNEEADA